MSDEQNITRIESIDPFVFHFTDPEAACPYWSNGDHIVTEGGMCRCGQEFMLARVVQR